jgi:hypothetical protein
MVPKLNLAPQERSAKSVTFAADLAKVHIIPRGHVFQDYETAYDPPDQQTLQDALQFTAEALAEADAMERAEGEMKLADGAGSGNNEGDRTESTDSTFASLPFAVLPITARARPATAPDRFIQEADVTAHDRQPRPQMQTLHGLIAQGATSFTDHDVREPPSGVKAPHRNSYPKEETSVATPVKYYRPITRPRLITNRPITRPRLITNRPTQETRCSQGRRPMTAPGSGTHRWDPYPPWKSRHGKEEEERTDEEDPCSPWNSHYGMKEEWWKGQELLPSSVARPVIPPRLSSQRRPETYSRPSDRPRQATPSPHHRRAATYEEKQGRQIISPAVALRSHQATQPFSENRHKASTNKKSEEESDDSDKWVRDIEARRGVPAGTSRGLMYEGKRPRKSRPAALQLLPSASADSSHQRALGSAGSRPSSQPSVYAKSPAYQQTFDLPSGYATAHANEDISESMSSEFSQFIPHSVKPGQVGGFGGTDEV